MKQKWNSNMHLFVLSRSNWDFFSHLDKSICLHLYVEKQTNSPEIQKENTCVKS